MKKIVLIVAVLVTGAVAQAQKFGVKAGLNISNFGGADADDFIKGSKIGFNAGALVNIPFSEMFSIQPEVVVSMEGAKEDDVKLNNSLINIPVLLQYNNPSGFYAELGPQVGFLLSSKAKSDGDEEDTKEFFKKTFISAAVGLGYKMQNGFGIGARYNLGLGKILDEDFAGDAKVNASTFQIGVSYMFGGSKK